MIEITKEEAGIPVEGELVYHSMDRRMVWEKTKGKQRLYIIYAGPPLKKGMSQHFWCLNEETRKQI